MRITEGRLRRIIREELLHERREASASDIYKHKERISQWVDKLLVDLANRRSQKVGEMDDERRARVIDRLTQDVSLALIDALGSGPSAPSLTGRGLSSPGSKYGAPG